jgi:transcriptional regulator with XRE-family HTH domain
MQPMAEDEAEYQQFPEETSPLGSFAYRLSELRRTRGLTQAELAKRAGVHPSQMHRYEAGTAEPTLKVLRGMALGLGVSSDQLIFSDHIHHLPEARLRAAVESAYYLSEHEQATVAELIEAFVIAHGAKYGPSRKRWRRKAGENET